MTDFQSHILAGGSSTEVYDDDGKAHPFGERQRKDHSIQLRKLKNAIKTFYKSNSANCFAANDIRFLGLSTPAAVGQLLTGGGVKNKYSAVPFWGRTVLKCRSIPSIIHTMPKGCDSIIPFTRIPSGVERVWLLKLSHKPSRRRDDGMRKACAIPCIN